MTKITREQIKQQLEQEICPQTKTKLEVLTEILYIQQEYFFVNEKAVGSPDLGSKAHQYSFSYLSGSRFEVKNLTLRKTFQLYYFPRNAIADVKVCHFKADSN